jgi:GTP:adenosylcobinamide-phosphate guanylyltransferase
VQRFSQRTVKVNKQELLGVLRNNRKTHIENYVEAFNAFRESYLEKLETLINEVSEGKSEPILQIKMAIPDSYEEDYNQIIKMLEMSVDDTIEVTAEEFNAYVNDKWQWKSIMQHAYSTYTGKTY